MHEAVLFAPEKGVTSKSGSSSLRLMTRMELPPMVFASLLKQYWIIHSRGSAVLTDLDHMPFHLAVRRLRNTRMVDKRCRSIRSAECSCGSSMSNRVSVRLR